MYQETQLATAKTIPHGTEVKGGVCKFIKPDVLKDNDDPDEIYLMLHPDSEGKPMVSRVDPETIKPVWSCWKWMDKWLEAYEKANPNDFSLAKFKSWVSEQPMTSG